MNGVRRVPSPQGGNTRTGVRLPPRPLVPPPFCPPPGCIVLLDGTVVDLWEDAARYADYRAEVEDAGRP